jgi:hypothetical protein
MANPDWNVKQLTSRDRVYEIIIDNPLKQIPTCKILKQRIIVDADDNILFQTELTPWGIDIETAMMDPILNPFVTKIIEGLEGLTQALYDRETV